MSKRPIHPSHDMSEPFSDIRAFASNERFCTVTRCKTCGAERVGASSGEFTDIELALPCDTALADLQEKK